MPSKHMNQLRVEVEEDERWFENENNFDPEETFARVLSLKRLCLEDVLKCVLLSALNHRAAADPFLFWLQVFFGGKNMFIEQGLQRNGFWKPLYKYLKASIIYSTGPKLNLLGRMNSFSWEGLCSHYCTRGFKGSGAVDGGYLAGLPV